MIYTGIPQPTPFTKQSVPHAPSVADLLSCKTVTSDRKLQYSTLQSSAVQYCTHAFGANPLGITGSSEYVRTQCKQYTFVYNQLPPYNGHGCKKQPVASNAERVHRIHTYHTCNTRMTATVVVLIVVVSVSRHGLAHHACPYPDATSNGRPLLDSILQRDAGCKQRNGYQPTVLQYVEKPQLFQPCRYISLHGSETPGS